jgi:hypothetical protein
MATPNKTSPSNKITALCSFRKEKDTLNPEMQWIFETICGKCQRLDPEDLKNFEFMLGPITINKLWSPKWFRMAQLLLKYASRSDYIFNIMSEYIPYAWPDRETNPLFIKEHYIILKFYKGNRTNRFASHNNDPDIYYYQYGLWNGCCTLMQLALWVMYHNQRITSCGVIIRAELALITSSKDSPHELEIPSENMIGGPSRQDMEKFLVPVQEFINKHVS